MKLEHILCTTEEYGQDSESLWTWEGLWELDYVQLFYLFNILFLRVISSRVERPAVNRKGKGSTPLLPVRAKKV
jgi:hypothetical protein